jgi:hypothetical protein
MVVVVDDWVGRFQMRVVLLRFIDEALEVLGYIDDCARGREGCVLVGLDQMKRVGFRLGVAVDLLDSLWVLCPARSSTLVATRFVANSSTFRDRL